MNQLFKDKRLGVYCGDKGDSKDCLPVSAEDFYPAVVLGEGVLRHAWFRAGAWHDQVLFSRLRGDPSPA